MLLLFFGLPALAGSGWVDYRSGSLSVGLEALELPLALEKIGQQTGIAFSVNSSLAAEKISNRFDGLDLETAIPRLLKPYDYMIFYDEAPTAEKRIIRVVVLDKQQPGRSPFEPPPIPKPEPIPEVTVIEQPQPQLVLPRDGSGHYVASGKINGHPVRFLLDTGATVVAIPGDLARQMNLIPGDAHIVETANGRSTGYTTTLQRVELGDLVLEQVAAVILPNMTNNRRALLGMSFLGAFDMVQQNNRLTLKQRADHR